MAEACRQGRAGWRRASAFTPSAAEACHGEARGTGGTRDWPATARRPGPDPDRTVVNDLADATTLFDDLRPCRRHAPVEPEQRRGLRLDRLPAASCSILAADATLYAGSLPVVCMPNRDGFLPSPEARGGPAEAVFPFTRGVALV
jgi:hypothetical protein